jgi:hypothetical protein
MKLDKPNNFDGLVFLAAVKAAGFDVKEVLDNGEGSLIVDIAEENYETVNGLLLS